MAQKPFYEEKLICSMFCGIWKSRCLSTVVSLGVPELLCNTSEPVTIQEIAERTGCRTDEQIYKVMRAMAQWGIGEEVNHKRFKANRAMELLRRDRGPGLGHMVVYYGSDEIWSTMFAFPEAVKTGEPAFELAHGMVLYDYMYKTEELEYDFNKLKPGIRQRAEKEGTAQRRREFSDTYNHALSMLSQLELLDAQPSVFTVYPWAECKRIMDVGGGEGNFLSQILKTPGCEHIHGILFDFPDVVVRAKKFLANEGVEDQRVTVLGGNILNDVPRSQEVDIILVKNFFVIFTEDQMAKTIENCSHVLAEGGKFLILNACNREAGDTESNVSKTGLQPACRSIHSMTLSHAGWFRTKSEWIDLIGRLCSRVAFRLNQVYALGDGPAVFELIKSDK